MDKREGVGEEQSETWRAGENEYASLAKATPEHTEEPTGAASEKGRRLELAEQWLVTQTGHAVPDADVVEAATASGEPVPAEFNQSEPVPATLASEVASLAQKRLKLWDKYDLFADELGDGLEHIRDEAINVAETLDFDLVGNSQNFDWPQRVRLNAMHEKFTHVSTEALVGYLEADGVNYEYRALYIRNIIADHAPELLTPDLRVLMDPSQPLWRVASTHASILFRNRSTKKLDTHVVDQMPVTLPAGNRDKYLPQDDEAMKPVNDMSDDELALYVSTQSISDIRARGKILFKELNLPAQETLLARRFFEMETKSKDAAIKENAGERNRKLQRGPILDDGDLVHATFTPTVLGQILDHGLQCGEAVMNNTRAQIDYPFTVSFLKVDENIATHDSLPEKLELLKNESYGAVNLVLHRDHSSTDFGTEQPIGDGYQRQIFGGVPSTEIKGIIIRENVAQPDTLDGVINAIVKNSMFIPVYSGSTGELLFSSEQFDQLMRSQTPTRDTYPGQ